MRTKEGIPLPDVPYAELCRVMALPAADDGGSVMRRSTGEIRSRKDLADTPVSVVSLEPPAMSPADTDWVTIPAIPGELAREEGFLFCFLLFLEEADHPPAVPQPIAATLPTHDLDVSLVLQADFWAWASGEIRQAAVALTEEDWEGFEESVAFSPHWARWQSFRLWRVRPRANAFLRFVYFPDRSVGQPTLLDEEAAGWDLLEGGQIAAAQEKFLLVAQNDPLSVDARTGLGLACIRQEAWDEAMRRLQQAADLGHRICTGWAKTDPPSSPALAAVWRNRKPYLRALLNLAWLQQHRSDLPGARATFLRLSEWPAHYPEVAKANFHLGELALLTNRLDEAYQYLLRAAPYLDEAMWSLVPWALRSGREDWARTLWESCVGDNPFLLRALRDGPTTVSPVLAGNQAPLAEQALRYAEGAAAIWLPHGAWLGSRSDSS